MVFWWLVQDILKIQGILKWSFHINIAESLMHRVKMVNFLIFQILLLSQLFVCNERLFQVDLNSLLDQHVFNCFCFSSSQYWVQNFADEIRIDVLRNAS